MLRNARFHVVDLRARIHKRTNLDPYPYETKPHCPCLLCGHVLVWVGEHRSNAERACGSRSQGSCMR
eukprot:3696518-Amphidinium_carterae.1